MPESTQTPEAHWLAEYNFWHKIITEQVERLRFNGGYEPIRVDLYPTDNKNVPSFLGKTQINHVAFRVTAEWAFDQNGTKVLRLLVLKAP